MQLSHLDLNLFRVFDAIYTERNLTRAAEVLSVTQPAVSNALARLRTALDDPLFVRTSAGMAPTPYAESIARDVAEALHLMSLATHRSGGFDPARSSRVFRLSMLDLLDQLLLAPLAGRIATTAPQVDLRNFRLPRSEIRTALARGTLDAAIEVALPDANGLIAVPFRSEPQVCAVRPGHPVLQSDLTIDAYLKLGHVHVSGRKRGAGAVDLALKGMGVRRNTRVRLQHYLGVGDVVRSTDLAVAIPESWARALNLACLPLPFDVPPLNTFLYRHSRSDGDEGILWLFDRMIEVARPEPDKHPA